jgi:hypothetical protein
VNRIFNDKGEFHETHNRFPFADACFLSHGLRPDRNPESSLQRKLLPGRLREVLHGWFVPELLPRQVIGQS